MTHPGELTFEHPARLVKTPAYPEGVPGRALKKLESLRDDMERAKLAGVPYRCFRTESDAHDDEVSGGDHGLPDAAVPTFEEYARAWQAARAVTKPLKARTLVENLRLLRNEVFPTFGRTRITKIAVEDVDRWWAKLLRKHPTRNKRNRDAYGILKQAMGAAVRDRRYPTVSSNPCQGATASSSPPPDPRRVLWAALRRSAQHPRSASPPRPAREATSAAISARPSTNPSAWSEPFQVGRLGLRRCCVVPRSDRRA